MKAPSSKIQAPEKLQKPSTKFVRGVLWDFEVWDLFWAWNLGPGAYVDVGCWSLDICLCSSLA